MLPHSRLSGYNGGIANDYTLFVITLIITVFVLAFFILLPLPKKVEHDCNYYKDKSISELPVKCIKEFGLSVSIVK